MFSPVFVYLILGSWCERSCGSWGSGIGRLFLLTLLSPQAVLFLQPSLALLPEKLLQLQCGSLADSKGVEETYIKFPVSRPFCLLNYVDNQILCISDIIVSLRAPLGHTHSWISRNRIVNHQKLHYGGRLTFQLLVTCISENRLDYAMVTKLTPRPCLLKKKQTLQPRMMHVSLQWVSQNGHMTSFKSKLETKV